MSRECPHGDEYGPSFACAPCQSPSPAKVGTLDIRLNIKPFPASYPGKCVECPDPIEIDDMIVRVRDHGYVHQDCHREF